VETFKRATEDTNDAATKRLIGSMVDVLEYSSLGTPVRRVLHQLCEGARQRVLATSVEKAAIKGSIESIVKAAIKGSIESIVKAAWLTDIESRRGKDLLVEAIKQLPRSPFLRTSLAAHFTTRVYWNHWRKDDRLVLLNAAEEALK
jgi:hypothetical protein